MSGPPPAVARLRVAVRRTLTGLTTRSRAEDRGGADQPSTGAAASRVEDRQVGGDGSPIDGDGAAPRFPAVPAAARADGIAAVASGDDGSPAGGGIVAQSSGVPTAARADGIPAAAEPLVLVAGSGGPDSMALAAATAFVAPRLGLRAGLITVDHCLQDGSADRAATVADWARGAGLAPVEIATVSVDVTDGGPEAAARSARYTALAEAAQRLGAIAILLGHTRDDQAETVLLALARGSGPRGLAAMPVRRGLLLRPLLEVPRADTEQACHDLDLPVWHDPHNSDPAYTRSRLRAAMPQLIDTFGPRIVANLARTAELIAADTEALDSYAAELLAEAAAEDADGAPGPVRDGGTGRHGADQARDPADGATPSPATTADGAHRDPVAPDRPHEPADGEPPSVAVTPGSMRRPTSISVATLARAHRAVRTRALRAWALAHGADAEALAFVHIDAMDALVTRWRGQGPVSLPGRVTVARDRDRLRANRSDS